MFAAHSISDYQYSDSRDKICEIPNLIRFFIVNTWNITVYFVYGNHDVCAAVFHCFVRLCVMLGYVICVAYILYASCFDFLPV